MIGVYKITSPSGKIYIGQTINIEKRIVYYQTLNCKGQRKLYNSLKKYGWENHLFEVLEECSIEDLIPRETHYKYFYDTIENGLNCGVDGKYGFDSKETKLLKSKCKKGNQYALGHIKSESTKKQISKKMKNHPSLNSIDRKIKLSNSKSIPVYQYTIQDEFIKEWPSAKYAAKKLKNKINGSDIIACLKGKQKTAYGYKWKHNKL